MYQHRRAAIDEIQRLPVHSPFKYFKRNTNLEAHSHFGRALNNSAGEDWRLNWCIKIMGEEITGWLEPKMPRPKQ